MRTPKILYLVTEDWYFWSHRLPLALAAKQKGYDVLVATRVDQHGERMRQQGFRVFPLKMQRRSMNPWRELLAIIEIASIYRREKPDIVHHVAIKPVLYGSLAAGFTGVRYIVNALAGLGYAFSSETTQAKLLRFLMQLFCRLLLNRSNMRTIFQNDDDRRMFVDAGIVRQEFTVIIRGSGVNMQAYQPSSEPDYPVRIILASRMLWDKGVKEFVEAARLLRKEQINASFVLVGENDIGNPSSVPIAQLEVWRKSGLIEWEGKSDSMPEIFSGCHVVCLPSYREGLPKVLIEAAACGKPIVTTDVPGCREVVRHNENGMLVPVRSAVALAKALQQLIEDPDLRHRMGVRGREIAENEFAIEKVVAETLGLYEEMLGQ